MKKVKKSRRDKSETPSFSVSIISESHGNTVVENKTEATINKKNHPKIRESVLNTCNTPGTFKMRSNSNNSDVAKGKK